MVSFSRDQCKNHYGQVEVASWLPWGGASPILMGGGGGGGGCK